MANKAISELPQAQNVNNQDLFVLEQSGIAKKLTAETFITEQGIIDALAEALDGHGGIESVTLSSVSGRIRVYLITFTDETTTTFQVYDGTSIDRIVKTSTAGLTDTYTVFMNDGTTTFFTVTNGADGTVSEAMLNDALKNKAPAITETVSGAIATFTDGADDMVMHNVVAEINPVQDLSNGNPSPSNICPISGHTEVEVTRTGTNLANLLEIGTFTESKAAGSTYESMKSNNNARLRSTALIPTYGKQITISWSSYSNYGVCFTYFDSDGLYLGQSAGFQSWRWAVTTINNSAVYYIACAVRRSDNGTMTESDISALHLQVEFGTTATAYEPYIAPTTVSLSWQTEAGTVYGGTIDVTTGVLTVDRALVDIGDLAWSDGDYSNFTSTSLQSTILIVSTSTVPNLTCSVLKTIKFDDRSTETAPRISMNNAGRLDVRGTSYASATAFKTAMTGQKIAYELATPQTYQLTGQQLKTLYGTNNLFSNVGNVSVTYPADTKLFIEKLTMPTEDDMVANQAITSGKYFMIGNSLYLALANIASGAQITIGTNAQRVSLADALNAINT